jgi:hypothetical protein
MITLRWKHLLLFLSFLSLSLAASRCQQSIHTSPLLLANLNIAPISFCKCTCFSNSTIIPLSSTTSDRKTPANKPPSFLFDRADSAAKDPAHHARTCADCTKQFCLSYNLPICSTAKEENVFTTCFQRDSVKDEAVVFLFIGATVGLLIWAGVRLAYERWREGRGYASVVG